MKTIEVLVFEGCPNVKSTIERARKAIVSTGIAADLRVVLVHGETEAMRHSFLGSPTVRVDGVDVDASAHERTDYGLQCRVYALDDRLTGAPPITWIEAALQGRSAPGSDASRASACCSTQRK